MAGKCFSLAALLERYSITEEECARQLSDIHLTQFSMKCCGGGDWKKLPPFLDLENTVAGDIDHDVKSDQEKRVFFLRAWKQRKGCDATYKALMAALLEIKHKGDAEYLCTLLKATRSTQTETTTAASIAVTTATANSSIAVTTAVTDIADTSTRQSLPEPVRADLKQQLGILYDEIRSKFSSYINFIRRSLQREGITAKELCASLLHLPAFDTNRDNPDKEKCALLIEAKEELKKANDICDIFIVLSSDFLTSFLNYGIYKKIVEEFDLDESHAKLKYPEYLHTYVEKHRVAEFMEINPQITSIIPHSSKELALKFDYDPVNTSVAKIIELKEALANILGVKSSVLRLFSIEEGCVAVKFLISAEIADLIFNNSNPVFTSKQKNEFQRLSVIWLKYNHNTFYFNENFGNREIFATAQGMLNNAHSNSQHSTNYVQQLQSLSLDVLQDNDFRSLQDKGQFGSGNLSEDSSMAEYSVAKIEHNHDHQEPSLSQPINRIHSNPQHATFHSEYQPHSLICLTSLDVLQDDSSILLSLPQSGSGNLPDDSPTARYIEAKAEEIVDKLNKEELLLSPIAESPTTHNVGPSLLGQDQSIPSMLSTYRQEKGVTHPSRSLGGENEGHSVNFHQELLLKKFRTDKLTVGSDGHYYQNRDYKVMNDLLRSGGFCTIRVAEDLTTNHVFAIKSNNKDHEEYYMSVENEARILAGLRHHENVIQIFGAVIDDEGEAHDSYPSRMYKLMMELSEYGTLSDMLLDYETGEQVALDCDQALYYFWQLLKGVDFIHKSGILHLDIKGANLLLFDERRTLKICDFGTAVHIDEIASSIGKNLDKHLGTPLFASPEICRLQMPQFSSDMWSAMCVLIEMLTAKRPWDQCIPSEASYHCMLFLIGQYKDENMERDLIPSVDTLPAEIIELMRLVFRAECKDRATAMELLRHPLIVNAYTYKSCFDEALEELEEGDAEEEEQESCPSQVSAPTSLPLSLNEDGASTGGSLHGSEEDKEIQPLSNFEMPSSEKNLTKGIDTPFVVDKPNSMFTFLSSHDEETDHMASAEAAGNRSFNNYCLPYPFSIGPRQELSMPSMPSSYGREEGVTHRSMSLGGESEGHSVYPHQELLYEFRTVRSAHLFCLAYISQ